MTKLIPSRFSVVIIVVLLSLLVICRMPPAFSQQQTSGFSPFSGPPTYQVYWNGSAWVKLSGGQQTSVTGSAYQGVTNITLAYFDPRRNVTFPNPTELTDALSFFSNVLDLDLPHYSVELMPSVPSGVLSLTNSTANLNVRAEHFILHPNDAVNATDGAVDIACMVNGGIIFWLNMNQFSGAPFLKHPAASVQDQAVGFLGRYVNYSGSSYIRDLRSLVDTYGIAGSFAAAVGNSTLQVNPYGNIGGQYLQFVQAPEGINNTYDGIVLHYQNGLLIEFVDFWNRVPIGSFQVNVNPLEAIQIAKQATRSYSFTYANMTVSNFTLSSADNAVLWDLTMQPRDGLLYPMYGVSLGLSRMYAGGITELQVGVWADTGQVAGTNYVSSYGGPSGAAPFNPSSASQTSKPENSLINTKIVAAVATIAAIVTIGAIVLKKKSIKQSK